MNKRKLIYSLTLILMVVLISTAIASKLIELEISNYMTFSSNPVETSPGLSLTLNGEPVEYVDWGIFHSNESKYLTGSSSDRYYLINNGTDILNVTWSTRDFPENWTIKLWYANPGAETIGDVTIEHLHLWEQGSSITLAQGQSIQIEVRVTAPESDTVGVTYTWSLIFTGNEVS